MDVSIVSGFSWYLALLSSFCFFSHPIVNCMLLVASVVSLGYGVYSIIGFSWYISMFCIVYVGGVYILLIFVFLSYPNSGVLGGFGCCFWVLGVFISSVVVVSQVVNLDLWVDTSVQLGMHGFRWGYVFLCVGMMMSLAQASIICSKKNSFYR